MCTMPRDKSWVMLDDRRLEPYRQGCVEFLDYAFSHAAIDGNIKCPCIDCRNKKFGDYESVHRHLLWRGMYKAYGQSLWMLHNEYAEDHSHVDAVPERNEKEDDGVGANTGDDMDGLSRACLYPVQEDPSEAPIPESNDFRMLIEEANTPLYLGYSHALDKWKDQHNESFGKLPNVSQVFDKAYLCIDPLKQLGSSTSAKDEGKGFQLQSGTTLYPEARRVSEDLPAYYDETINAGRDKSTANTRSVSKVFGRTTRLGLESSRSSKQRSKRTSSIRKEIDALREQVVAGKKKREDLEHAVGSLLNYLRQQGILPPDDHIESPAHQTESNEEHLD